MKLKLAIALVGLSLLGCKEGAIKNGDNSIKVNQIPAAVTAAFNVEHPYAQINNPSQITNEDGSTSYQIPYTRPDGTKGTATYAQMGELQKDQ